MKRIQSLSLIIGSLLSVAIVCAQLFHFQSNTSSKKEVKAEQQETNQPADASFSIASFSLPSPIHISVNLDACCLFEILFEQTPKCEASADAPLFPEKLFMTLFRVIISPNAP
jgi:hypothetical protein